MPGPEHVFNPEHGTEKLKDLERAPEVLDKAEHIKESPEEAKKNVEQARTEAQEALASHELDSKGETEANTEHPTTPHTTREQSYKHTMKAVRAELIAPERTFSKVIHNPVVERVSDAVSKTIARPDALLSGSIFACIAVLGLYVMARFYGFELRGSETILAFLIGWVIGIIFDVIRGAFKRNRS